MGGGDGGPTTEVCRDKTRWKAWPPLTARRGADGGAGRARGRRHVMGSEDGPPANRLYFRDNLKVLRKHPALPFIHRTRGGSERGPPPVRVCRRSVVER